MPKIDSYRCKSCGHVFAEPKLYVSAGAKVETCPFCDGEEIEKFKKIPDEEELRAPGEVLEKGLPDTSPEKIEKNKDKNSKYTEIDKKGRFRHLLRMPKMDQKLLGILLAATLFFLISFMLHNPNAVPSNYSDIISIYNRPEVTARMVPYIDFNFEHPVLSGLLVYLASLTGSMNGYYYVFCFFIYLSVLVSLIVIYRLLKEYKMDVNRIFLFCIATPSFIFFSVYTFDWIGIFLGFLSIYFFMKKRIFISAIFLGLAIATRIIPILFLPVFFLNMKDWRKRILFLSIVAVVWLIPNSYFMVKNFDGWSATYISQFGLGIENSFLIFFFPQVGAGSHYASVLLMLMFTILIIKTKLYKNVLLGCLAFTLAFMISSYKVPPQYALMLLPLLTLVPVVEPPLFYTSEFFNLMITLIFFSSFAGENGFGSASPVQWVNVLRQGIWVIFLIKIFINQKNLINSSKPNIP